jgi:hypothetical protein
VVSGCTVLLEGLAFFLIITKSVEEFFLCSFESNISDKMDMIILVALRAYQTQTSNFA